MSGEVEERRRALIERARGLSPTDPRFMDQVRGLRDEWKGSGRLPRDVDQALYAEFNGVLDRLFQQRNAFNAQQHQEVEARRRALIERARGLSPTDPRFMDQVRGLRDEWKGSGRLPRDVDQALYAEFNGVLDRLFQQRKQQRNDPAVGAALIRQRAKDLRTTGRAELDRLLWIGAWRKEESGEGRNYVMHETRVEIWLMQNGDIYQKRVNGSFVYGFSETEELEPASDSVLLWPDQYWKSKTYRQGRERITNYYFDGKPRYFPPGTALLETLNGIAAERGES